MRRVQSTPNPDFPDANTECLSGIRNVKGACKRNLSTPYSTGPTLWPATVADGVPPAWTSLFHCGTAYLCMYVLGVCTYLYTRGVCTYVPRYVVIVHFTGLSTTDREHRSPTPVTIQQGSRELVQGTYSVKYPKYVCTPQVPQTPPPNRFKHKREPGTLNTANAIS